MIFGTVTEMLEATVSLELRGDDGKSHQVTTVIDTGFSGDLTLRQSQIDSLRLPWLCRQQGMLADGSLHTFDVYVGTVVWEGGQRMIEIEAGEIEPLLGMSLLEGNQIAMDVRAGGEVTIKRGT